MDTPNNSENETKINEVITDRRKIASKENIRKALAKRNEILKEKKRLKEELEKAKEESESDSDTEEIIYIHPKKGTKKYVKSETEVKPPIETKVKELEPSSKGAKPEREYSSGIVKERVLRRTISEYPTETESKIEPITESKPTKIEKESTKKRYSFLMLDD